MNILHTVKETTAAGPGIRYEIYVAGCEHHCGGCHNPETWDFGQGNFLDYDLIRRIIKEYHSNPLLDGITISGGDPLHPSNAFGLYQLLASLQILDTDIWVYTGYTIENLYLWSVNKYQQKCLQFIDMLVDGKYDRTKRDTSGFAGSLNQRYIKTKELIKASPATLDNLQKFLWTVPLIEKAS